MKVILDIPDEAWPHISKTSWQRVINNANDTMNDLLAKALELGLDLEAPEEAGLNDQLGVCMQDMGDMTYWPDRLRSTMVNAYMEAQRREQTPTKLREEVQGHVFYAYMAIGEADYDKASVEFRLAARRCDEVLGRELEPPVFKSVRSQS